MRQSNTLKLDKFREECGVVGIWNNSEAANLAYLSLYSLQHRGQEGAGVVALNSEDNNRFSAHRGLGLVSDVFNKYDFSKLPGKNAIGHNRYTTAGSNHIANVQPFFAELSIGKVALAHNGNLTNAEELRAELKSQGAIFSSTSDTEVILHLLSRTSNNIPKAESVILALKQLKGAYSLVILFEDRLFAVRDPNGVRPLAIGELKEGLIFASETCAFDLVKAKYLRDVEPGEIIEVTNNNQVKSYFPFGPTIKESPCIFEYIYFARPDSRVFGRGVSAVRERLGQELAKENPVEADVVIPVPDSGNTAAIGYSQASGIPYRQGLVRNHYVGRTFIEPKQEIRDFGVRLKLNPVVDIIAGKRIVVVDDSIVRGTTSKKLIKMLREVGAKEIHLRISAPPTIDPCYYGIDTPEKSELIASHKSIDEIASYLGVDSLGYLSMDGLYRAVGAERGKFCDACFSGNYPISIGSNNHNIQTELFE